MVSAQVQKRVDIISIISVLIKSSIRVRNGSLDL